jgi:predicted nucleic acid-binding protein
MTATLFVDTNVFVYARQAREPGKRRQAIDWIDRLWREQTGRTSVQVLSEYYVNVTRKIDPSRDPDDAWDDVKALMSWNPLPTDRVLIEAGREIERRYRTSWWDSLIVAAAQLQGCTLLLTEDLQDGAVLAGVTVRNPFTLKVAESESTYAVQPRVISRHPRRGRPRKQPAIVE